MKFGQKRVVKSNLIVLAQAYTFMKRDSTILQDTTEVVLRVEIGMFLH